MDFQSLARQLPWNRGVTLLRCDENGLVAIDKPTGTLSHPNKRGDSNRSLLNASYDEKRQAYRILDTETKDEQFVYLLNRLDSATSGIVLLALREETAKAVLQAFEGKSVRKIYCAIVFGAPRDRSPIWRDRISVKRAQGGVRASLGGGLMAETKLIKVEPFEPVPLMSRLTLMPITGRTHQLRIQTSKRKMPIVGDRTYGDFQKNKLVTGNPVLKRLCLHCLETELEYEFKNRKCRFKARSNPPF